MKNDQKTQRRIKKARRQQLQQSRKANWPQCVPNAPTLARAFQANPAACRSCRHPIVWQDRCNGPGGPWRCMICCPPPSRAIVARQHDCSLDVADEALPVGDDTVTDEETAEATFDRTWLEYRVSGWRVWQRRSAGMPQIDNIWRFVGEQPLKSSHSKFEKD